MRLTKSSLLTYGVTVWFRLSITRWLKRIVSGFDADVALGHRATVHLDQAIAVHAVAEAAEEAHEIVKTLLLAHARLQVLKVSAAPEG